MSKAVFITGGARGIGNAMAKLFYKNGYNCILPCQRAHRNRDEKFTSMGYYEKFDVISWINYIISRDPEAQIVLLGISMGSATVMLTTGERLPEKGGGQDHQHHREAGSWRVQHKCERRRACAGRSRKSGDNRAFALQERRMRLVPFEGALRNILRPRGEREQEMGGRQMGLHPSVLHIPDLRHGDRGPGGIHAEIGSERRTARGTDPLANLSTLF